MLVYIKLKIPSLKNKMKIEYQKQAVINAGYNYIIIINKDYSKIMI